MSYMHVATNTAGTASSAIYTTLREKDSDTHKSHFTQPFLKDLIKNTNGDMDWNLRRTACPRHRSSHPPGIPYGENLQ